MGSVRRNFARDKSNDSFRPDWSQLVLTMIPPTVGRQGHFVEVTTDGKKSIYLGGEDSHEHKLWFSSTDRVTAASGCLGILQQTYLSSLENSSTETYEPTSGNDNTYYTPKQDNIQLYQNFRTISFISNPCKVMMKVILNRLYPQGEAVITEEQDGFKAEMTATEQRHLKNLFEKVSST